MNRVRFLSELEQAYDEWQDIYENGGNAPYYPDGVSLNVLRSKIITLKKYCSEDRTLTLNSELLDRPTPPEMPCDFMRHPDEIREKGHKALELLEADENYKFIIAEEKNISPKAYYLLDIALIDSDLTVLRYAVEHDDLVVMRRYGDIQRYLDTYKNIAEQMKSPEALARLDAQKSYNYDDDDGESEQNPEEEPAESLQMTLF